MFHEAPVASGSSRDCWVAVVLKAGGRVQNTWPQVKPPESPFVSSLTWRIWGILAQVPGPGIGAKLGEVCRICDEGEKSCFPPAVYGRKLPEEEALCTAWGVRPPASTKSEAEGSKQTKV